MKDSIKNYYENEVQNIKTPPMPTFNKKKVIKPWDNILLTAMAVASLVIVYLPSSYNSGIRNLEISEEVSTTLKERFSRVILEVDLYYLEKKGVLND